MSLAVKNSPVNAADVRDTGLSPGLGRSPGGGHGNPLQHSCLKNSMDRGEPGDKESDATEATEHAHAVAISVNFTLLLGGQ